MKLVVKIISIGNICLDIILRPADRLPKWSTELFFKETQSRSGGQGLNFAVASALFGNTTLLASNMGMDQAGAAIEAELSAVKNLDLRLLRRTKEPTGFTVSVVRSDGERFFLAPLGHQREFWTRKDREEWWEEMTSFTHPDTTCSLDYKTLWPHYFMILEEKRSDFHSTQAGPPQGSMLASVQS